VTPEPTCFPLGKFSKAELRQKKGESKPAQPYPMRILVAEDDYITRRVLVMFLQHEGHQVANVENGLDCLKEAQKNPYDLILTDIDMPHMSGIDCAAQLRHAGLVIPIIALSSSAASDPRQDCLRAGMNEFLPKPVPPDKLRSTLRDAYFGRL